MKQGMTTPVAFESRSNGTSVQSGPEKMVHVFFPCLLPTTPKSGLHAIRIAICTVIALSIRTLPLLTQLDKIMLPHLESRPQCDEMTVYSTVLQIQCRRPSPKPTNTSEMGPSQNTPRPIYCTPVLSLPSFCAPLRELIKLPSTWLYTHTTCVSMRK